VLKTVIASAAWALGAGVASAAGYSGNMAPAAPAATATRSTTAAAAVAVPSTAVVGTAGTTLPPPPPTDLTQSPARTGVPPTPAPPDTHLMSSSLQSSTGFDAVVNNQLRPSVSANATQVANVQATLAAGGLYSGPIDGIFSAATRAAVARYQDTQRLPATGELDGETVARLMRGAATGGTGANGATSTAGTSNAFGSTFNPLLPTVVTTTATGGTTGTVITSTPFPLSGSGSPPLTTFPP
jgi:peptidoglycan hydrolase-like protein with peptidoglycan-binding domain